MREIIYDGNLFLQPVSVRDACCVTTNGVLRRDGKAVMGAGIAKYCRDTFTGVDEKLGQLIKEGGNHAYYLGQYALRVNTPGFHLFSFPTKDDWRENSKPELIRRSCKEIMKLANEHFIDGYIYMPCPGCNNGQLNYWRDVRSILMEELDDRFTVCVPEHVMKEGADMERHSRQHQIWKG